jgi:hypothetical protein
VENWVIFLQFSEMRLPQNGESFNNDCLGVNLKVLRLAGLWQNFTTHTAQWTVKVYNYYKWTLLFLMIIHATSEITDILLSWGDLKNLAENGSVALMYIAAIFKQISFILREQRIKLMISNVKSNFSSMLLKWRRNQNKIIQKANRRAYIVSWIYYLFGVVVISCFVTKGVIKSHPEYLGFGKIQRNKPLKTLIIKAWYPFDIQQPHYYLLAFVFQILVLTCGPIINIGIDTLIVSLIVNCCGQFEVLHYSLRTIKERAEELMVQQMVSVDRSHNMKNISRHKKDINFKKLGVTAGKLRKANEWRVRKRTSMMILYSRLSRALPSLITLYEGKSENKVPYFISTK